MVRKAILKPYEPKARYIPKLVKHEESIQRQVCQYLRLQYPHVIFRSDYASGLHLTAHQARLHAAMQSGRAWPDLFVYHPRKVDGQQYAGLALELKKEGTVITLKNGNMTANLHIREQAAMLDELSKRGYWADFAVGFDDAINKIDHYMGKPENIGLAF
jgi:hypothetical protein